MDEDDIIARLSRALDTQSVALTDDGASTQDVINKLSQQINDLHEEETGADEVRSLSLPASQDSRLTVLLSTQSEYGYDDEDYYDDEYEPPVQLPNRPTPFEVWAEKNSVTQTAKPLQSKKLKDHEWDGLVERLHGTKRSKESTIKQQQNQELAEQLRELHFKVNIYLPPLLLARRLSVCIDGFVADSQRKLQATRREHEARAYAKADANRTRAKGEKA